MADRSKLVLALAILVVLLSGCLKSEEFPNEPRIEFLSFERTGDSAVVTISFTDGDGDIGLAEGDTFPPYDEPPYDKNLYLEYEEFEEGAWVPVQLGVSSLIGYRIPVITPTGQNKTLEGEIAIRLQPFVLFHQPDADTIRYGIRLFDRALNESNKVYTGTILVP
ncbi:MAG: hypothetical protein KDB88_05735 [Flavobacteriales bacterium]|nr:hypothetical protein [Flavobacteriales bacterium]